MGESFLKINERLAGMLAYVLGPASGLFFYIGETVSGNNNRNVKFHALQSTVLFGGIWVLTFLLGIISFLPFMGLIIRLVDLASFVAYVYLIYSAYVGKNFRVPIVGDACYQQVYK